MSTKTGAAGWCAHSAESGKVSVPIRERFPQLLTRQLIHIPSLPIRISGCYPHINRVGPMLGEDNDYVVTQISGLDEAELERLEKAGVIGKHPRGTIVHFLSGCRLLFPNRPGSGVSFSARGVPHN
jgi:hypothetical protein